VYFLNFAGNPGQEKEELKPLDPLVMDTDEIIPCEYPCIGFELLCLSLGIMLLSKELKLNLKSLLVLVPSFDVF
jgi:hypothetical protein